MSARTARAARRSALGVAELGQPGRTMAGEALDGVVERRAQPLVGHRDLGALAERGGVEL